jgi:hypothetical protein
MIFSHAFRRPLMERYLLNAYRTMDECIDALPSAEGSRFEVVSFMRSVIHRFAFRCWAGEEGTHALCREQSRFFSSTSC